MADGVACESSRCWAGPYPSLNLELNSTLFPSLFARCRIRYNLLADAQRACSLAPWCGGIVQDGGFNGGGGCTVGKRRFELRSSVVDEPWKGGTGWFLHANSGAPSSSTEAASSCMPRPCAHTVAEPQLTYATRVYSREAALRLKPPRTEGHSPRAAADARTASTPLTRRPRALASCLSLLLRPSPPAGLSHLAAWLSRDDEVVRCLIRSGKPFLIGRPSLGAERDVAYLTAVRDKPIPNGALSLLGTNAGVITHGSRESAQAFGHAYLAALNTSDLSVRWDHSSMPKPYGLPRHFKVDELLHVTGHLPNLVLCHESIEPWLVYRQINTTWMAEMAHRTLLVVSPFNESIRKMLDKGGRAIWGDASEEMLPSSMVVKLVRPPVNIGGFADTQSGDWRDSLASLIAAVDAAGPFDLALLSCGGLGMLVAAHLRRTGRAAIYTGGALQLQFGVKGRRWLDHPGGPYLRPMANPSWEWPLPSERPPKRHMIDKGAYWT